MSRPAPFVPPAALVAAALALAAGPADAVVPPGSKAYVLNPEADSVTVVSLAPFGGGETKKIAVGELPQGAAMSPDRSRLYVANSGDSTVSVIDTATDAVIGSPVQLSAVGTRGVGVSTDGATVFVACQDRICVLTGDPLAETSTIAVPQYVAAAPRPVDVAVHPSGDRIYVVDEAQDMVIAVTLATRAPAGSMQVFSGGAGKGPAAAEFFVGKDGHDLLLVVGRGGVRVFDTSASDALVYGVTPVGSQLAAAVSGSRAVVANVYHTTLLGGTVEVYDFSDIPHSHTVTSFRAGGLVNGVTMSPDGTVAWASCHTFAGHSTPTGTSQDALVQFDPSDTSLPGVAVASGAGGDGAGPVIGWFPGAAPPPPPPPDDVLVGHLVPTKVALRLEPGDAKDLLRLTASIDDGDGAVDWDAPVTLDVGGVSRTIALGPLKRGRRTFKDPTLSVTIQPNLDGSSRGTLTATFRKQPLEGVLSPLKQMTVRFRAAGLDVSGTVEPANGKTFELGKRKGTLLAPAYFPLDASIRTSDTAPDVVEIEAGFLASPLAPESIGTVRFAIGDAFSIEVLGSEFTPTRGGFRHESEVGGRTVSVVLDFLAGRFHLNTKGHEVGTLGTPTVDVECDVGAGAGAASVRVRLGTRGSKRVY